MDPLERLRLLHGEIDALAAQLERFHEARLQCRRGCSGCCVDDITVFEIEAERIRAEQSELLRHEQPHPAGACAFLDAEGACRIYASRPYVCRTQGLPIRWLETAADGGTVEYRDICELNIEGPLITDLKPGQCWTIGPTESKLFALGAAHAGAAQAGDAQAGDAQAGHAKAGDAQPVRVALRSLFQG